MTIEPRHTTRWFAAAALALAAACGSPPNIPDPPPVPAAPQITCPVDVAVKGVTGTSQQVTYSAPTVTGGAAPVTVTCTQASGTTFPLGTTSVSCAANDAQARQATCSFKVTLSGFSLSVTKFETFGDSFTEGENGRPPQPSFLDIPNAYPTKLQRNFDALYANQGIVVMNRGHSGDPVERTVLLLRDFLPVDKPGAVLVLTGFNNLLDGCRISDGQNPLCSDRINDVAVGVRDCIHRIKESSAKVSYIFVSTLTPPGPLVPPTNDRRIRGDVIVQVNSRIKQIVAAEGATVADPYPLFIGHEAEYVDNDGLHPRPAGNQAIADAFFAAIRATVPQAPLASITGPR